MATIPGLKSSFNTIDLGSQFVKLAQLAAAPAFELQFSITQNSVLDRLDAKILKLQESQSTSGATALLEVNIAGLKRDVGGIQIYADRTKSNRITAEDTVASFTNLIALADSSTVAEFDARLASTIADIEKLDTPLFERYGARDGLRKVKEDALAQLNALAHNNFATAGDISSVQATLNSLSTSFSGALEITRINEQSSISLANNTNAKITDLDADITSIKLTQQAEKIDAIEKEKERFAQILTSLSLSFEAGQALTSYLAENTVFKQEVDPGSVLNLFA